MQFPSCFLYRNVGIFCKVGFLDRYGGLSVFSIFVFLTEEDALAFSVPENKVGVLEGCGDLMLLPSLYIFS